LGSKLTCAGGSRKEKQDFTPVVEAFNEILSCFFCDSCGGLVYVSPPTGRKKSFAVIAND
jgi:hypothetical protein